MISTRREEGFFSKYISQPVKKFYNYITGKTEESDNVQSTADDLQSTANDVHNIVQENSESLDTHVQSNENDII